MGKKLNICALVLALLLLVPLAGCGGPARQEEPTGSPEQTATEPALIASEPSDPTEESGTEDEAIHVSTAGEFLEAIVPGAVIELAPGTYNLTEYLREASDTVSDYVVRGFNDGWQAEVRGVEGLTIRGATGGEVEVVAEPRYCDVLYFNDCSDIAMENITFGHTIEPGNCQGAVLAFDYCQNISLHGLDLYGCGTYGVAADHTVGLALKDCIIRECSYGIVDLRLCSDAVFEACTFRDNAGFDMLSLSGSFARFEDCTFTGNEGTGFLPAYDHSGRESGAHFERCTFGSWESNSLAYDDRITVENCSWSEITVYPDDPGEPQENGAFSALDTTRLKAAPFDAMVLAADEYYILYQIVNRTSGEVRFETGDDVRFLTFEEDSRGCFWTDDEKGRPFGYAMDSAYSCAISFDDGGAASVGLYADQGGALPDSEEGTIWLALYLEDEVLWCY